MAKRAKKPSPELSSHDTVDSFFRDVHPGVMGDTNHCHDTVSAEASEYWTLPDAAAYFGVSPRTVLRRLQAGTLDGFKMLGSRGPEWRVKTVVSQDKTSADAVTPVQGAPDRDDKSDQTQQLLEMIKSLQERLEAATYRNGYLTHQIEAKEQTIHLLTTSNRSWWQRFQSWLTGDSVR